MSSPEKPDPEKKPSAKDEADRKRRLTEVFGDVLPAGTSDDNPESWGDRETGSDDEWYRNQVPPHHG